MIGYAGQIWVGNGVSSSVKIEYTISRDSICRTVRTAFR